MPRDDRHLIVSPPKGTFSLIRQLAPWTFAPAEPENLIALHDAGVASAAEWLKFNIFSNTMISSEHKTRKT